MSILFGYDAWAKGGRMAPRKEFGVWYTETRPIRMPKVRRKKPFNWVFRHIQQKI